PGSWVIQAHGPQALPCTKIDDIAIRCQHTVNEFVKLIPTQAMLLATGSKHKQRSSISDQELSGLKIRRKQKAAALMGKIAAPQLSPRSGIERKQHPFTTQGVHDAAGHGDGSECAAKVL